MISKCFEEFYSELNSMSTQDIKHALEEDLKNLKKCTAPFEVRDIVEQQQSEIEKLKIENQSLRGAANSYKLHYNKAVNDFEEFARRAYIDNPFACQYCEYSVGDGRACLWKEEHEKDGESCLGKHFKYDSNKMVGDKE